MRIELRYSVDEILQDVGNRCYLAAQTSKVDGKDRHEVMDVLEGENQDLVLRLINKLMYQSMNLLYPFTKCPVKPIYKQECLDEVEFYVFELEMNHDRMRSHAGTMYLKNLLQDYIVYKCQAEWMSLTMPDFEGWQTWEAKAEDQKHEIVAYLAQSFNPKSVKIKPHYY